MKAPLQISCSRLRVAVRSLLVWLLAAGGAAMAQTYTISAYNTQTVTATAGTFYDSGGSGAAYSDNEDYRVTFTTGSSNKLKLTFTSFATEAGYDFLRIYDGSSTASTLLGTYDGGTSPGTITASGSSLTLVFTSDGSVTDAGWAATISTVASTATSDYGDYSGFGTASATANSKLRLGTNATDAEAASPANSIATGDDATGDDEDLALPSFTLSQVSTLTVPVLNNMGTTTYVSAWIDFNNNGSLTDSGEQVVANQSVTTSTTAQTKTYSVTVPATAVTGTPLGLRFRLNSTTGVAPTGTGGTGEVEDYLVTIGSGGAASFAMLAVNYNNNTISRFNGIDGSWLATWSPAGLSAPNYAYRLSNNTLLVANGSASTITKYDAITGASLGTLVNNSVINFPYQMAISPDGNICLANQNADNIVKFNQSTGAVMATLASLSKPAGLVFGNDGLMYVTQNISAGTLRTYTESGTLQQTIATYPAGEYPRGLAWGPDGRLYVNVRNNNSSNGRVDVFTFPGGAKSTFVTLDAGSNPYTGIKWGPDGNLYVVDYGENEISVYNSAASLVRTVTSTLNGPHAVAFTDLSASSSDYGDFSGFGSASSVRNTNLRLGNEVDTESQARTSATANGDDIDDLDDEDGVTLPALLTQAGSSSLTAKVTNATGATAYLNAWIDFNNNGVLTDSGEQIATNVNIVNGTSNATQTLNFTVPATASVASVGVRVRLVSVSGASSVGVSGNGEIEDYKISIEAATTDFGDHASLASASSNVNSNLKLGAMVDAESSATTNASATGDDTTGTDDEDGVTLPTSLTPGSSVTIPVTVNNATGATGYLNAWIDFNNDGTLNNTLASSGGERLEAERAISSVTTGAIFREWWLGIAGSALSDLTGNAAYPNSPSGSDTLTSFETPTDWADNLGQRVRGWLLPPTTGTYTFWVAGDDQTQLLLSTNDSPGNVTVIASVPDWSSSREWTKYAQQKSVAITLQAGRYYYIEAIMKEGGGGDNLAVAWELPGSGTGPVVIAGQYLAPWSAVGVPSGVQQITFTVPAAASPGTQRAARFRVTNQSSTLATGAVGSGEVEDYAVSINAPLSIGNLVWNDTDNDGVKDAAEPGLSGAVVQLFTAGADNTANTGDDVQVGSSLTTDATGSYLFSQLPPGNYFVKVTPPAGTPKTSGTPVALDNNVDSDNNGSQPGGSGTALFSPVINLASGAESTTDGDSDANTNLTVDFGLMSPLLNDFGDFASFGSASSIALSTLRIGASVDTETGTATNATATSDDTTGTDDEDGATLPATMTVGTSTSLPVNVTNSSGTAAFLNVWIDFNRNGVLTDAGEQVATNVSVLNGASNSVITVNASVPAGASNGAAGVRVRLTSTSSPGATGASGNGEVEDHTTLLCPVITITPTTLANGIVGSAYAQATAFTASGGTAPYVYTASNLPAGISLDATNRKLIGTPTTAGTTSITITATDANGCPGSVVIPFTHVCPAIAVSPTSLAFATVGSAYSQATAFSATGGSGIYSFGATGLPAGMSFDAVNKKLTGIPTAAGLVSVNVTASDSNACAGAVGVSLRVCPQLTISPATLPVGVVSLAYSQTTAFSASGGSAPYTWSVSGLPSGLSWDNTNLKIVGTPTAAGTSTVTLVVTDANNCPGTTSLSLVVNNKVTIADHVWADVNNNGTKDVGETGIDGVTLVLRYDANGDGDFVDSGESSFATTTTSGGGLYQFTGLSTGRYRVVIPTPPPSHPWASKVVDLEDNQQDNDNNGYQKPTGGPVVSPVLTLSTSETDSTIDFGLVPPTCSNEKMVMYLADLQLDIVHKFKATGGTGVEVPGSWGGIPWLRTESADATNGITNPHGAWFNGQDIYIGGIRGGSGGTFRYNQQGQLQARTVTSYRLTHVTVGNYIYYPMDSYVRMNDLATGAEVGRVNLTGGIATTWGITVGNDGYLYVNDNYQSSTFPNGNAVKGSGHIYRIDSKPSTFTSTATVSYSPIISGLDDMTGIDTDWSGNIYVVEVHIFDNPSVYGASRVRKYSPQGTLLATYTEPTPLDNVGVEDAWGMRWNPLDNKLYIATRSGDCVARLRADTMTYDGAFVPYVPNAYGKTLSLQIECATLDLGDLPDTTTSTGNGNYQTLQENGGPTHIINSTLRLGASVDAEHAASPSADAMGDDLDGTDDENAVSVWPSFTRNTTQTVAVNCYNASGTAAKLYGYFDWNSDGDFGDTNESVTANVPTGTNGTINLSVTVPSTAVLNSNLGARLRLSTSTTLLSTGAAPDGEVEDAMIQATNCATIAVAPSSLPNAIVGQAYTQATAFTASGGNGSYTFSATTVPTGMSFSTNKVTGTPTATGLFNMEVKATDTNTCQGTVVVPFRVCPVITIAPISIGNGIVGYAYNQTLTASGGASPYTWSVTGAVPTGLSVTSGGVLTGTPTSVVSGASFTVTASDANGCSVSKTYTMSTSCPVIGMTPTASSLPEGLVGSAYSTSLAASGGSSPYVFTVSGGTTLPAGLTLSSAGVISGTPTAGTTGTSGKSFTAQVSDQYGCSTTRSYNLKVCPVIIVSGAPPVGAANAPYTTTFTAAGGVAPYTWSVSSGTLPVGLGLNATSGVVSGTPTEVGSENVTLMATDANGCPGVGSFTIAIGCPAITVAPASLPVGLVGTAYSASFSASGGTTPYTWTLASGTLPTGLTLSSAGVLSGIPTAATVGVNGTSIVVRATDGDLCATTKTLNLKICPVITISPATLPNATVGVSYSRAISAAGGTSPYGWSIIAGSQPSGLSLNASTGSLSGTPSVAGVSNFTVQALDAYQCPGTKAYTLRVCPVLGIGSPTLPVGTVGTPYQQGTAFTASAGTAPYTFSASNLPAGMSFDAATKMLTGTPTAAGTTSVTINVQDVNGCTGSKVIAVTVAPVPPCFFVVSATGSNSLARYSAVNGSYVNDMAAPGSVNLPYDMEFGPDGHIYVVEAGDDDVLKYDRTTGALLGVFVSAGSGGLSAPRALAFGPNGNLFVGGAAGSVLEFHGTTGGYVGTLVVAGNGTDNGPREILQGLTFGPDGHLYIGDRMSASIRKFNGSSGTFMSVVADSMQGLSNHIRELMFGPDGFLYVTDASHGSTPAPKILRVNVSAGTVTEFGLYPGGSVSSRGTGLIAARLPSGMTMGPDNLLYVTDAANSLVSRFNSTTGAFVDDFSVSYHSSQGTLFQKALFNPFTPAGCDFTYAIGNRVFHDNGNGGGIAGNGIQDGTEPGISGVVMRLLTHDGSAVAGVPDQTTDASGYYRFDGVVPGYYYVSVQASNFNTGGVLVGWSNSQGHVFAGLNQTDKRDNGVDAGSAASSGVRSTLLSIGPGQVSNEPDVTASGAGAHAAVGDASDNLTVDFGFKAPQSDYGDYALFGTAGSLVDQALRIGALVDIDAQSQSNATATSDDITGSDDEDGVTMPQVMTVGSSVQIPVTVTNTVGAAASLNAWIDFNNDGVLGDAGEQVALNSTVNHGTSNTVRLVNVLVPSGAATGVVGARFRLSSTTVTESVGAAGYGEVEDHVVRLCPVITVTPGSLSAGVAYSAYTQGTAFLASGGTAPYVYTQSGTLPPGMSFNATTRTITGTPSVPGSYSFTITATDANGCPGSTTYNLAINCPAIAVAPASIAGGTVNASYTQTFTATGGNGIYTWSVVSGSLPPGLTLSPGGVLSGGPTVAGSSNFTVQARDSNGCLGSKAYAMTVVSLKVGNQVWSDLNNNGFKDSGEPGVSGVVVQLWKVGTNGIQENGGGDDVQVGGNTVTNVSGVYGFVDVAPATGYYLRLPAPPPANAMSSAVAMTQDDGVDGDNNGVQIGGPGSAVRSPLFTLAPGTEPGNAVDGDDANGDQTLDFGLVQTVCVGNLVFKDVNNNGTFEVATDQPAAGVIVKLFNQGADPLSSLPVASMTTGSDGLYLFSVRPGSFFLYVAADQFVSGAPLYGTKPTKGRSDTAVPNIDDNGDQNALVTSKPMATGVRTGNFTLAIAAQPTAALGETGHQSTSDDGYDAEANLTVDLGFYPLSGASAPLAGVVRRDLSRSGTTPLPGVEVALYADANSNGSLDTPEMLAVQSVVTDEAGEYAFEAVLPGDYLLVQSVLPGAEATFDTDGGAADVTRVTLEGEGITGVDFHQALVEETFAEWQQKNPLSGSNAVHDNPDGDLYDNLLEYALGTAADEGQATKRFHLEADPGGRIDAVLVRSSTGHADVAYELESSAAGATWTQVDAAPVTTQNSDGTETLRFANVGGDHGFIRLKVELDADHDGTAEAMAYSPVHAFHQRTFAAGTQTFSMPLLKEEVYAGTKTSAPFSVLSGQYVEDMDATRVVVRPHWTVLELFPVGSFSAGATSSEADRLLFFENGKYRVLWLLATNAGARWVVEGDASMTDAGSTLVKPGEGLLVHKRIGRVTLPYVGLVRSWSFITFAKAGTQLVGSGYPVALSPAQRGMSTGFTVGSRVQLWKGDALPGSTGYQTIVLTEDGWKEESGVRVNDTVIFEAFRAAFLTVPAPITRWTQPLPSLP